MHTDDTGVHCIDIDTDSDGHPLGLLPGRHTIELVLDRLDLAEGTYHLDVGVYERNWEETFDYLWQARRIDVTAGGPKGLLSPPRRWKIR
jgi:hypothetical protein